MLPFEDDVFFYIDGERVNICSRYSVRRSICTQPSSFSMTIGSGDLTRDLLSKFRPLAHAELKIGGTKIFDGYLEDPIATNQSGSTEVTIQGRDCLYKLAKSYIQDERSFGNPTYADLTREVMQLAGMDPSLLVCGNESNRKSATRLTSTAKPKRHVIESIETGLVSGSGAKIKYETVTGQIGQSWLDFLLSHYKKAGLYLWCGADGRPILSKPDWDMGPIYGLRRYRGIPVEKGTILSHTFTNRTSTRHARVRCYGKGKPDKNGQLPVYGEWHDQEMLDLGFGDHDLLVLHNDECRSEEQCAYVAKRQIADERRANRTLVYVTPGHTVPSLYEPGKLGIWTHDTMLRVNDQELAYPGKEHANGINEDMYIETVVLNADKDTGRTAELHLMRKIDLLYLGEDPESEGRVPRKL